MTVLRRDIHLKKKSMIGEFRKGGGDFGMGSSYAQPVDTISDTDRIAAADAYIEALATHDADSVPFAPDCVRIEQGIKTGFSGNHLRRGLRRGPQYRVIAATVDGDQVHPTF